MSSSGQAPNVSMDDLLASIKSMIEGESNGGANSQLQSDQNLASADPAMQGGANAGPMDDVIMDLTNVVQPQQQPELQDASLQQDAGFGAGTTAEDAASHLNDILGGGDIGVPASNDAADFGFDSPAADAAGQNDPFFGDLQPDPQSDSQIGRGLEMGPDMGQGQMQGQPPHSQHQQTQQPHSNEHQLQAPQSQAPQSMIDQLEAATQSAQNGEGQLPDEAQIQEQLLGNMPLDQGAGAMAGFAGQGAGGRDVPAPHSPTPQSPIADSHMPAGHNTVPQDQAAQMQGQGAQMDGMQEANMHETGMQETGMQEAGLQEAMGGHDPRLENELAMGAVLQQADASLNLSLDQQKQADANAFAQSQAAHNQMTQAQAQALQQQQMASHMRGLQQPYPPQGQPHLQSQGLQPGQMPGGPGGYPQGHPHAQVQGVHQGQMPGGYPPGQQGQPHLQSQGLQPGHHGQLPAVANGDMLPVPSGFRPTLPAVQQPMEMAPLGDQLPLEMRNNLEEIVKQLLKPLLREWLAQNLPELLKGAVDEQTGKIDPDRW